MQFYLPGTGFLPIAQHAQVIDPASGVIVNWNNKPSVGTFSADDEWGWGPVQRVLALRDRIQASIKAGKLSPATLDAFRPELGGRELSKGTIHFTADDPLPDDLVTRIVEARMSENRAARLKTKAGR